MDTTLAATSRDANFGKGPTRKLRAKGRLPAVLYAEGSPATALHVDPVALDTIFRNTRNRNTVLQLDLDGQKIPCLVQEAQRHPLTREILHLDLYKLDADRDVEVEVPVEPVGKPAGLSLGGRIRVLRRTLKVRCKYTDIPEKIPVDVTPLNIGDRLRISEIPAPAGTTFLFKNDVHVVDLAGKSK